MPDPTAAKRKPKAPKLAPLIEKYYADLKDLAHQNVLYEMGTRPAFHALLANAAKPHGWTLIAEHEKKVSGTGAGGAGVSPARTIRPDGTFKDHMNLVRGYWEAKDTADNLDAEIAKKRKAGYPVSNIIFEDTATAVLFQHGQEILRVDMKDPVKLADLLTEFFRYIEPDIEEFEHAVDEFKQRVPDLAEGLKNKIEQAHKSNKKFQQAFTDFFELCRTSLNPNLSAAAVDEMLIQHILTERLIREIFDNPEFVRRNVIAAEVEKIMQAMTSHSFDRNTYLRELDRFYVAIEHAARTMTDFADKQHFLNTVYERFFQGYSVKLADTMGIVYTPQEIVDFMCASVAEVLEKEFGKQLWSDDVYIIDPCTGTGNFIVNLIRRIPKRHLEDVYKHRLFANEIMLLPYYIAALNIEHAYFEQTGKYEAFEGLCFVDTLDLAEHAQKQLGFMTAANTQRVERQRKSPITVVIGNPPYNYRQVNENDNNKNRKYDVLDRRVTETYARDSTATNRNALADAYIRFFRWAVDRLGTRDGIVCYVTNNGFIDQIAFDGFRKHLCRDFSHVYHVDLAGDVRSNPTLSGTMYNVFGIQVGVGVTVAIRKQTRAGRDVSLAAVPKDWRREVKLRWLSERRSTTGIEWNTIPNHVDGMWLRPIHTDTFQSYLPIATKIRVRSDDETIFNIFTLGVTTARDNVVYDFDSSVLRERVKSFAEAYNSEVDRYKRGGRGRPVDEFVRYDSIKWSRDLKLDLVRGKYADFDERKIRRSLFRPFCRQFLFYDRILNEEARSFDMIFPSIASERENAAVCIPNVGGRTPYWAIITSCIAHYALSSLDATQCFPFYVYDEDGSNRRENITDWALKHFRDHYKDNKIDKWAIFHYVYGVLHHPGYRDKFADNLKRELPRIPLAPSIEQAASRAQGDRRSTETSPDSQSKIQNPKSKTDSSGFWAFSHAGKKLASLHLDYEKLDPYPLKFRETPGEPLSYRVDDKMRLNKDKTALTVNKSLTLEKIPPDAFAYRLGNRSALEWVIDQYQVYTDPRSQITSDPNRDDDPEYIVRLVGQVIRVSIETMKLVNALPKEFADVQKA